MKITSMTVWFFSALMPLAAEKLKFAFERQAMGTRFAVVVYGDERESAEKASDRAFAICDDVNQIASDYLPESEISKIHRTRAGERVQVSPLLLDLLDHSRKMAEMTEGAFDPALGRMTALWRESRKLGALPDVAAQESAQAAAGWTNFRLEKDARILVIERDGLLFDLGGVAKGFAADLMLLSLRESGFPQAMVVAGGDVRMGEAPPGREGWGVAVQTFDRQKPDDVLVLSNAAVSTSGDLYQWVEIDGVRYSHIVDPRTGLGLRNRIAATVVADQCKVSDPVATAACVSGEEGLDRLRKIPGVRDVIIRRIEVEKNGVGSQP